MTQSADATSPRFAVHIMAHDAPHLFAGLVESLSHDRIDVYAHIDAKSDAAPFEATVAGRGVHFVTDRVRVNWGGLSQIHATLALLDAASTSGVAYHRHSLLSGRDVALRTPAELVESWSGDTEFLRIDRAIDAAGGTHAWAVDRIHFPDRPLLRRLGLSGRVPRRHDTTIPLCQGSQWWSLTDAAVSALRTFLAAHPHWLRNLRHTLCPDELVVGSILAASPFTGRISHDLRDAQDTTDPYIHGQHFIDWSGPTAVRPPELDDALLAEALSGPANFARKAGDDWTWRAHTGSPIEIAGSR